MSIVTTEDGVEIFYKDWGPKDAQPLVFHHGWPLSADDWDAQLLFFLANGYRVVAHDRRGAGRAPQGRPAPRAAPRRRLGRRAAVLPRQRLPRRRPRHGSLRRRRRRRGPASRPARR